MRWVLSILGVILVLVGIVWILQGVNVLAGSYMSGHLQYTGLGIIAAIVGIGLLVWANRRRRATHGGGD